MTAPRRISIDLRFLDHPGSGSATYHTALWEGLGALAPANTEFICHGAPAANGRDHESWRYYPGPKLSSNLWNLVQLPRRLRRLGPDLHHSTLNFQAPLRPPCPLVLTLLDLIPLTHARFVTRRYSWLFRTLIRPALQRAQRIIVLTETGLREAADRYPDVASRLRAVPCALRTHGLEEPDPATRDEVLGRLGVPDDYLLFVGPPEPRKNLKVLLRAIRIRSERGREGPPLVMVGSTHLRDPEQDALIAEAGSQVIDCGRVSDPDLDVLRATARGLLFPTVAEGFGYPPLEALAVGVPVAVSRIPVLEEVLGDGARFVDPHDAGSWADALEELAGGSPEVHQRTVRGREHARSFSVERLARETLNVYEEVLENVP